MHGNQDTSQNGGLQPPTSVGGAGLGPLLRVANLPKGGIGIMIHSKLLNLLSQAIRQDSETCFWT